MNKLIDFEEKKNENISDTLLLSAITTSLIQITQEINYCMVAFKAFGSKDRIKKAMLNLSGSEALYLCSYLCKLHADNLSTIADSLNKIIGEPTEEQLEALTEDTARSWREYRENSGTILNSVIDKMMEQRRGVDDPK